MPSRGTSAIVPGIKVNRTHHLLSELEATYFFLVERRSATVDIREQWPILDIDRTLELCSALGVSHQHYGGFPGPFTIDFLITELVDGNRTVRAASVKTAEDARDPAIRLRLAVEHAWCREKNIPWTLVDTSKFSRTLLANLRFMRTWFRDRFDPASFDIERFERQFLRNYSRNILLGDILGRIAKVMRISEALALDMFRYAAWFGRLDISHHHELSLGAPLVLQERRND